MARKYIYGPGLDEPICMIDSAGNAYYYYYDGLGSVTALSHNGIVVERYKYDPFGITTVCDGSGTPLTPNQSAYGNRFMFTGREFDAETGLYYYRARMYSPGLGRFMQPDPIGYADSMNLYQYCGNNPVNFIDPWGLCSQAAAEEWNEIINIATEVSNSEVAGWYGSSEVGQCADKAFRIYNALQRRSSEFKYWRFEVGSGKKFIGLGKFGGDHSFTVVKPTNDNPYRAMYLDNFQWSPYQMSNPKLKYGPNRDIRRRFPYHQEDSLF